MAAKSAAQILAGFYQAETAYMASPPEQRDFASTIGRFLAPSFRSKHSNELPWGGTWQGHEGFKKWSEQMADRFNVLEVLEPHVFDSADHADEVMVSSTLRLVTRRSGREWRGPLAQSIKVDLNRGWIDEIRVFWWNVDGLKAVLSDESGNR